jgi:hypothetical protein
MKRIALCLAFLLGLFLPKQNCAQSVNWADYAESFNERVFFAYALQQNDDFELACDEASSLVVMTHCNDASGIEAFLREKHAEFLVYSGSDKLEFGELLAQWRESLPEDVYKAMVKQEIVRSMEQNNYCYYSEPFCTDNGMYEFPAGVNAGSGEWGPYYDCLRTTPNPAWYYMRILDPGDMDIYMYSSPLVDIDFCCWGPYDDPFEPCPDGLTRSKVVSCSYLPDPTETCEIRGAQHGEYYILLITNYSNHTCNIHFSKVAGQATTDCSILPPLVSYDAPICTGQNLTLHANGLADSQYHWFQVGGSWTSDLQNPVRPNATVDMSGTYGCAISHGSSQSDTTYLEVVVDENYHYSYDLIECDALDWGDEVFDESGHYTLSYVTPGGCDSIVELNIDMNYTPLFEIQGAHWPIGGSETHISVNEYAIQLEEPRTRVDTVIWEVDCPNWYVEPHGIGMTGTLYIYTYLLEPVMLHAWVINRCGRMHQEFFIQTSYFGVDESVANEGFEVFPNPTNGEVVLCCQGMAGPVNFEVYNVIGQLVDTFVVDADMDQQKTYNLRVFPAGIYTIVARSKSEIWTKKVVLMDE